MRHLQSAVQLFLRSARREDTVAVMEISATVWEGHDYLPEVWERWLEQTPEDGFLVVADVDSRLVGIQHTSLQPGGVAWMEGIRVHPEFRNQGIGGRMLEHALSTARTVGCHRSRLSTARINQASSKIAESNGFEEIAIFHIFTAGAADERPGRVRRTKVTTAELQDLRARLHEQDTLVVSEWTAYDLPAQKSPADFTCALVYEVDRRIAGIGLASESRDRTDLCIAYLDGSQEAIAQLALAMRAEAGVRGLRSATGMLRRTSRLDAGLLQAGFTTNRDLVVGVYERGL